MRKLKLHFACPNGCTGPQNHTAEDQMRAVEIWLGEVPVSVDSIVALQIIEETVFERLVEAQS